MTAAAGPDLQQAGDLHEKREGHGGRDRPDR